ncbi:hypothetical protein CEXT_471981 [Caerostris extrusa]|uniref:Uncharacterized protein n=1 Tax=Caerostris extrusa TaxID=172846 RepID=A0AAV4YAY5_CAEEX|nr:hypothetical protein CEXT_471981 [Caerostris extrusa]
MDLSPPANPDLDATSRIVRCSLNCNLSMKGRFILLVFTILSERIFHNTQLSYVSGSSYNQDLFGPPVNYAYLITVNLKYFMLLVFTILKERILEFIIICPILSLTIGPQSCKS